MEITEPQNSSSSSLSRHPFAMHLRNSISANEWAAALRPLMFARSRGQVLRMQKFPVQLTGEQIWRADLAVIILVLVFCPQNAMEIFFFFFTRI